MKAVPTLGCPAKGISRAGVKMRTRRVLPCSAGRTKVVSEKLNSRAMSCMVALDNPSCLGQHGQLVAPESGIGEHVADVVFVFHKSRLRFSHPRLPNMSRKCDSS